MTAIAKLAGGLIVLILIGVFAAGAVAFDASRYYEQELIRPAPGFVYEVKPGATLKSVAADLQAEGLLTRPWYWVTVARWEGRANKIKAGEYALDGDLTPAALLDVFTSGKTVQYAITLVEGWTFEEVLAEVAEHSTLEQTLGGADPAQVMAALGQEGVHPEGWFYPDTYNFPRGTTDLEFLKRSHETMRKRLAAEWEGREEGLPIETPYEALILASIVERETGVAEERPLIAAVFISRLKKGMKLQTDPTVIYGMGADYDGNIRRSDLTTDTPYNTYVHAGLTPTPIAMPSGEALHAVLHPAQSKALFFVARGDG
ncbi:MAG: endolytic transglycosylase MltG, partial [Gammaproteobacteria bacterium]